MREGMDDMCARRSRPCSWRVGKSDGTSRRKAPSCLEWGDSRAEALRWAGSGQSPAKQAGRPPVGPSDVTPGSCAQGPSAQAGPLGSARRAQPHPHPLPPLPPRPPRPRPSAGRARAAPAGPAALAWANQSGARDFVLLGFAHVPALRPLLAALFLALFLAALAGNALIALLPGLDPALRAPMYFFLRQLALVELCFSLDVAPRLLLTLLRPGRGVSPAACALQLLLVLSCVTSECFLLTAMAWDRFVAICRPLRYGALVSLPRCRLLAAACWLAGVPVALVFTVWLFSFPFCGPRGIRHFFCDIAPLLSLVCADTSVFEAHVLAATVLVIMVPFCLIAASYAGILAAVLRMPSAAGRLKALSTCASHLIVVVLFYGTTGVIHLRPKASYSPESKQVVSLSYTLVTPVLNPLIYSLRNKEVKAALGRVCRCRGRPALGR